MSFETYVLPILIFAVLGLLAGVLLTVASKVFEVKVDERIEKISEVLPQANCGACGFAGCGDYATAIVEQGAATNLCKPGGMATAAQVSGIMGTEAEEMVPEVAVLHCNGNCNATQKSSTSTASPVARLPSGSIAEPAHAALAVWAMGTACMYATTTPSPSKKASPILKLPGAVPAASASRSVPST